MADTVRSENIIFWCKQIIVNNDCFDLMKFVNAYSEKKEELKKIKLNGTYNLIDITNNERFIKIYIEYGCPFPHPDKVIDLDTGIKEENPRTENQIEPKQMFVVIDANKSVVWSSNFKRSNIIIELFKKIEMKVKLKNIYDAEEFIQKIQSINGIRISSTPENLFKTNDGLSYYLDQNIYGYGADKGILKLEYKNAKHLDGDILENFKQLFDNRISFESFVVSGKDDLGMDIVFNSESLVKTLTVSAPKRAGIYEKDYVFGELIGLL